MSIERNKIPSGDTKTPSRISRRKLFKLGLGVTAAGAVSLAGFNEVKKYRNGVETENGIFYPLYEHHDIGIDPAEIPENLDLYFKEFPYIVNIDNFWVLTLQTGNRRLFDEGVLEKLARQNTEIMFGDILTADNESVLGVEFVAGIAAIIYSLTPSIPSQDKISRRNLLKKGAGGFGVWALAPFVSGLSDLFATGMNVPGKRLIQRADGAVSHLHPEDNVVFFRNLMMADKLLTVSEKLSSEKDRKVKIAFNVGAGHSGIEDFLQMGPRAVRHIILNYPNFFLNEVADLNGGVADLCTSRLIKLAPDFGYEEAYSFPIEYKDITDETLATALDYKLKHGLI